MRLGADYSAGVDTAAVYHDGEVAVGDTVVGAYDGYCLPGLHGLSHLYEVLCVVAVHGLKPVAVAYHYDVAQLMVLARQAYGAVEHTFYGIALGGGYLHAVVLAHRTLAHGQWEGVLRGLHGAEVYVYGIGVVKQSGSGYAYLLLLGGSELVLHRAECREGEG